MTPAGGRWRSSTAAPASSSTPRASPGRSASSSATPRPAGRPTRTRPPGMGVPSLDGLGPIGGNDHAPAEYLEVDSIVPRTTLLAGLLLAIAGDPRGPRLARRACRRDGATADLVGRTAGRPSPATAGRSSSATLLGRRDDGRRAGRRVAPSRRHRGPGAGDARDHRGGPGRGRVRASRTSSGPGCSSPTSRRRRRRPRGPRRGLRRDPAGRDDRRRSSALIDPSLLIEIEAEARRG